MIKQYKRKNIVRFMLVISLLLSLICIYKTTNVKALSSVSVQYQAHVQNIGWQSTVSDGAIAGTVGKSLRMEAIKINVTGLPAGAHIVYQTHVQGIGWQASVQDGAMSGTSGKSLRVEAIKIQLVGVPIGYHVQYRTQVERLGWLNWVQDGAISGTTGQSLRMESIRIQVIQDPITGLKYSGQVQNIGWMPDIISDGTSYMGKPQNQLRLESMKFTLQTTDPTIQVKSQAYVDGLGWMSPVYGDGMVGTVRQSMAIQGLKISLVNAPGETIDYQAYFKNAGWTNWVANGSILGVPGNSDIMTALRVRVYNNNNKPIAPVNPVIVQPVDPNSKKKIAIDIGHNCYPDTGANGIRFEDNCTMAVGTQVIANLQRKGYTVISTKPPSATTVLDSLSQRTTTANTNGANIFASIHFNLGGGQGTEVYYYADAAKPMAQNVLNQVVALGYYNRGVKYNDFYVIRNTKMPSILVECSFLDSQSDMNKYNPSAFATAITNGLIQSIS